MSPLEPELLELMLDEITLEAPVMSGGQPVKDAYGELTYDTPITGVQCQITRMNRRALDRQGSELVSTAQIILGRPDLEVTPDWRATLPDGTQPAIIQVAAVKDDVGVYYEEIFL